MDQLGPHVQITVQHPGYVDGVHVWGMPGANFSPIQTRVEASIATNLVLHVAKKVDFHGQIQDDQGRAVGDAKVEFSPRQTRRADGTFSSMKPVHVVGNPSGQFALTDVLPWVPLIPNPEYPEREGELGWMIVRAEGFVSQALSPRVPEGIREPLKIVMQPGVMLKGRIEDEVGKPVAGASLGVNGVPVDAARSAADGSFELGPVLEGTVEVVLIDAGPVPEAPRTLPTNRFQTIVVRRDRRLDVDVVDAVTGKPVPEFDLRFLSLEIPTRLKEWLKVEHHADSQGHWTLSLSNLIRAWDGDGPQGAWFQEDSRVRVQAPGYLPGLSAKLQVAQGVLALKVALTPATWLEGTVFTPDGKPAERAQVAYVARPYPAGHLGAFDDGPDLGSALATCAVDAQREPVLTVFPCLQTGEIQMTDARGTFSLPPRNPALQVDPADRGGVFPREPVETNDMIVVVHSTGIAEVRVSEFTNHARIDLKALGALDFQLGDDPKQSEGWQGNLSRVANPSHQILGFDVSWSPPGSDLIPHPNQAVRIPQPAGSRLQARDLPPGDYRVSFLVPSGPGSWSGGPSFQVTVAPGMTNQVHANAGGRKVQGRFVLEDDVRPVNWPAHMFASVPPRWVTASGASGGMYPVGSPQPSQESPPSSRGQIIPLSVTEEGTFSASQVPPGDYVLNFDLCEAPNQVDETLLPPVQWNQESLGTRVRRRGDPINVPYAMSMMFDMPNRIHLNGKSQLGFVENAMPAVLLSHPVKVPAPSGTDVAQPVELGEIKLQAQKRPRLGEVAPVLEGAREDGSLFRLSTLKGKWVLLIFGANESSGLATEAELSCLTSYASDGSTQGKVEVVVLNLDSDVKSLSKLQSGKPLPWPVVHAGPWGRSQAATAYGVVAVPEIILLNPDGRIAGLHLRGQKLIDVLDALVSPRI